MSPVAVAALNPLPLQQGAKGINVRRLQRWLAKDGYNTHDHNGSFGVRTAHAVAHFQTTHGLSATGVVDETTAGAVGGEALAGGSARTGLPAAKPAVNYPVSPDGFVFPIYPMKVVSPQSYWSEDQGVDISTINGTCGSKAEEVAIASGTIVKEGIDGFGPYAPVLKLDSGPDAGRYVYYGHAAPALVAVGAHVVQGQPIADVGCGTVGISSAPHIEIGISPPGSTVTCCPGMHETSHEMYGYMVNAYTVARGGHVSTTTAGGSAASGSRGAAAAPGA